MNTTEEWRNISMCGYNTKFFLFVTIYYILVNIYILTQECS